MRERERERIKKNCGILGEMLHDQTDGSIADRVVVTGGWNLTSPAEEMLLQVQFWFVRKTMHILQRILLILRIRRAVT